LALSLGSILLIGTTPVPLRAQGNQRPLSDFINAQGQSMCFTPPAADQLGWATGVFADGSIKTNGNTGLTPSRGALIDSLGLEAKYLLTKGIDLGTTVSGSVMERPLADGRALVTVNLHTHNALGWAFNFDPSIPANVFNGTPLAFGSRVLDVVAGKTPALGDSHFQIQFTNTAPGAPLPQIPCGGTFEGCTLPDCPAGFEVDSLSEIASITGPLHPLAGLGPEGTPGRLAVQQIVNINPASNKQFPSGQGPLWDTAPVEAIDLHAIGK
jgi:hypothetical protein